MFFSMVCGFPAPALCRHQHVSAEHDKHWTFNQLPLPALPCSAASVFVPVTQENKKVQEVSGNITKQIASAF